MSEGKLAGRVAIVTGSSRGIGKAVALGFAWEGARLVVCSRTAGGGELTVEATVRAIEEIGADALGVASDVTQEDQVNEMVRQTIEQKKIIPACVCLATQTDEGISGQALDDADFGLTWP
jgi:NAD(P)-dependent dehydrogenase (short-subunit alcohol dehydrogenase family)